MMPSGGGQKSLMQFGQMFMPREAAEPILARPVRDALMNWLTEIFAADELEAVGILPRRRAIFDGPPGGGKTTLAHHLCARLGLPMLAVRPETLIDTWLGSTGRNIGQLFELASEPFHINGPDEDGVPVVLFLDEFDAIAMKRKDARQGADDEQNAWINTLLQRIEQHDGFIIAATNYPGHIDQAIWRRFDMHISIELPGPHERERILARYLMPFVLPENALRLMADAFATASPALMRQFCEGMKREIIIGPKLGSAMDKQSVVDRLTTTIHPHPDLGKPPLWSNEKAARERNLMLESLPWPLSREGDAEPMDVAMLGDDAGSNVVSLRAIP